MAERAERGLDWLIETAEAQVQEIIEELHSGEFSAGDKRGMRAVLQQLIGTLQKLYYQRGIEKPSADSLAQLIEKLPAKAAKKVDKAIAFGDRLTRLGE